MQILQRSHFEIITVAGILLLNIRIHCTLEVIPTVLSGMRPGTIFRVECVAIIQNERSILGTSRGILRVCVFLFTCLLVRAKKQSTCYTKRFNVWAQKPQVTQCILTRNIVHWITLEKVPLIFPRSYTRTQKKFILNKNIGCVSLAYSDL